VRCLTPEEIASYDLVPAAISRRARLQSSVVMPRGYDGLTVGRFIFLRDDSDRSGRSALLAHELVHVEQYSHLGTVTFLWRYLREYLRNLVRTRCHRDAYAAISFEVEARRSAAAWSTRREAIPTSDPE